MHLRLAGILPLIAALAASPGTNKSESCSTDHHKDSVSAPVRGLLASLRSIGSTVRSDLAFTRRPGGGTAVHASRDISPGEVLFRIPHSALLWRSAHVGTAVAQAGHLTGAERLVLALAAIKKGLQTPPPPIEAYGAFLQEEPLPNATILWRTEVLAWLKGTEAAELTEHFLRRIALIHAAAPLLLECTWRIFGAWVSLLVAYCSGARHDDIKARGIQCGMPLYQWSTGCLRTILFATWNFAIGRTA